MKNINHNNIWVFRALLAKKCAELQNKIDKSYSYQYTKKEPVLKLTIEISHDEFNAAVLEKENEILTKKLTRAQKKLKEFEELREKFSPPSFAEQLQLDADNDRGKFYDCICCPRCDGPCNAAGQCGYCDFPGPPV
jgi:DNA repair exonuclease SbcCD nuclease subunit